GRPPAPRRAPALPSSRPWSLPWLTSRKRTTPTRGEFSNGRAACKGPGAAVQWPGPGGAMTAFEPTPISAEQAGLTLAAYLRQRLAGLSWREVRRLVETRRVRVDGELCLDAARRLRRGVAVELLGRPLPSPRQPEMVVIRHLDEHLVV